MNAQMAKNIGRKEQEERDGKLVLAELARVVYQDLLAGYEDYLS